MIARTLAALAFAAAVSACATVAPNRPEPTQWVPRADADLAADLAACTDESYGVDLSSSTSYAISRYAAAAAMAYQIERGALRGVDMNDVYLALRNACMEDRGWVEAE